MKRIKKPLKKILVIYTGGTFGMRPTGQSKQLQIPKLSASELKTWLKTQVPEMMELASCDVDVLFNLDSCQFQASHWFELAAHIMERQNAYDGVVILHGTDTLPYTAAALSFLLSPTRIPVVITGAQKPLATLRNDARTNFISALEIATHAPKVLQNRVLVVFHDEVFLGSRVRKKSAVDFSAFESPRFPKLASVGSEIQWHEIIEHLPSLARTPLLTRFRGATEKPLPRILDLQITPQFPAPAFSESILNELDGILLTLYTSGTAPTAQENFLHFLERSREGFTPIFAITEREDETPSLATYAAGRELIKNKVLWCGELTPEAAFVKIWLLRELYATQSKKEHFAWLQKHWDEPLSDECGKIAP